MKKKIKELLRWCLTFYASAYLYMGLGFLFKSLNMRIYLLFLLAAIVSSTIATIILFIFIPKRLRRKKKDKGRKDLIMNFICWGVYFASFIILGERIGYFNTLLISFLFLFFIGAGIYKMASKKKEIEKAIREIHDELHKEKKK